MKRTFLIALGAAFSSAAPAQLLPQAGFEVLDTDRNGALSRIEAAALPGLLERFDEFDRDGDGRIAPTEFRSLDSR